MKSVDGRAYQLSHSGHQVTYTGPGDSASVEAPPSCPPMSPKPAAMCPPGSEVDTCQVKNNSKPSACKSTLLLLKCVVDKHGSGKCSKNVSPETGHTSLVIQFCIICLIHSSRSKICKNCKCKYNLQGDGDCVGPGHAGHVALCCYNGCGANACLAASHVVPRSVVATTTDTCPVVETKTEQQCANATANCWSRGECSVIYCYYQSRKWI